MGKCGGCAAATTQAICRIVSIGLRGGMDLQAIINQLRGIRCPQGITGPNGPVLSCPDAIGLILENFLQREQLKEVERLPKQQLGYAVCPTCGGQTYFTEGCMRCKDCNYTRCG